MSMCDTCANYVGCDIKGYVLECRDYKKLREINHMKKMLEMQKELQEFLGTDFEDMSMEERVAYIKEHSIHLNQEINEALYELPYFKPWKDYSNVTEDEVVEGLKSYKKEMVDAFHFFMNMLLAIDVTAEEFEALYMEKNAENFERQRRGYTHDVSYRTEGAHE